MRRRQRATTGPGEPVFFTMVDPMLRPTMAQRMATRPALRLFDDHVRGFAGRIVVAVTSATLRAHIVPAAITERRTLAT